MIKIENVVLPSPEQWEAVIRGMRNPKNSWDRMDSEIGCEIVEGSHELCRECAYNLSVYGRPVCGKGVVDPEYVLGFNDHDLMTRLASGGPVHAKYRRMIPVYLDITRPLYWWKEFDTYKVGTVANSCSTMHKIRAKEFEESDFSCEHLFYNVSAVDEIMDFDDGYLTMMEVLHVTIYALNENRKQYLQITKELKEGNLDEKTREAYNKIRKQYWWQMIQLLPSSYNQKRTVMLNYEVLVNIYNSRRNHKLDEWHVFCEWIESLPYAELITGEDAK